MLAKENGIFCKECGSDIGYHGRKFCSNKCQGRYNTRTNKTLNIWLVNPGIVKEITTPIRRFLINESGNKCSICSWCEINPYTGNVPLEIDHIDGDSENNVLENLRVICPNCHSLTETYKGANRGRGRHSRRIRYSERKSY